ncbi:MAG: hypothetical protein R3B89_08995 [Polyangiaceae bacterium]
MLAPTWLRPQSLSSLRSASRALRAGASALSLLACSGADDPGHEQPAAPIPCEVQQALEHNCLRCHGEHKEYGAPYSFTSLEEIHRVRGGEPLYRRMLEALEDDFMPPVTLKVEPPVADISDADRQVLLEWTRAGAPEGQACE